MRNKFIACFMACIVLLVSFNGIVLQASADDIPGMGKTVTISSASLDRSGTVAVGDTFKGSVTVINTSGVRVENVYVESSASSANISIQSFSKQDVGALAAGESYTVYFSYSVPQGATGGETQIKFTAYANGAAQDSYQTNLSVIGETKEVQSYFDVLSVMAPSKISSSSDDFKIALRFIARGGANNVKVEWSTANADAFEPKSPQIKSYGFMMTGTSEYLEFEICPTDKIKTGSHTFVITISGTNAEKCIYEVGILVEKGENDDARGIKVISTEIPASAKTGEKFQIKNVLQNTGSAASDITVTLVPPKGIANNSLSILKIPALGKNEQKEITFDLFVTSDVTENYNMFELKIEYGDSSNTHYMGLNITADKSKDIKISSTNVPASAKKGEKFQIKATVVNEGGNDVKNISVTLKNPAGIVNNSSNIVQIVELKKGEKKEISFDLLVSDTAAENYNLFELVISHDDVTKSQYVGLNITFDGKPAELAITTSLAKNIKYNTDFKLSFTVKNNGGDIKNLVISVPNPTGIVNKTANTFLEPLLKSGASITKEISFSAKEEAAGSYCLFEVSASSKDTKDADGKEIVYATQYSGIAVDYLDEKSEFLPVLSVDSIDIPYSAGIDLDFKMEIKIFNKGAEAKNVILTLEPQTGLINKTSNTVKIDSLKSGDSNTVDFTFMATEAAANGYNAINIKLAYSYKKADGTTASGEEISQYSGLVVINPKKEEEDPDDKENKLDIPVVIISRFDFGGEEVYGGKSFNFTLEFLNTHKSVAVQDLKITLSQEKGIFTPKSGSNTFFVERLGAGQRVEKNLDMVVKTDTLPDSYGLTVTLSYKNEKGDAETATEVINIPVQQEIRFTVWEIPLINEVNMGDEAYVNIQFGNLGKSTIYNVRVTVVSDDFYDPEGGYPAGILEAGKTTSKAFYLMPTKSGMLTGKIRFEYEDSNSKMMFEEVDISFMVTGGSDDMNSSMMMQGDGMMAVDEFGQPVMAMEDGEMPEESKGFFKWLFTDMGILQWLIVIGVPVVVIAAVVIIVIVIRRKRAKIKEDDDDL